MRSIFEKYSDLLPTKSFSEHASLGEGNTPLVKSSRIGNGAQLYFKAEQTNPTGSFKDRFAAVETELMRQQGIGAFFATSSGNTGSSLAAYSARHGFRCMLFVNEITPSAKLNQMLVYGAEIFRVKDFGVTGASSAPIFDRLRNLAAESGTRLVISAYKFSPEGMEGVKTLSYEIVEQLGSVPGHIFAPVGGGGLLSAIWRGFLDMRDRRLIDTLPKINAVQPKNNDTLVTPLRNDDLSAREVTTTTGISGLAVQVDIDATLALHSVRESGGNGYLVDEEDVFRTQLDLSSREGLYVEPAGAVSTAGYLAALSRGEINENETAICILTGHGLKTDAVSNDSVESRIKNIDLQRIGPELLKG